MSDHSFSIRTVSTVQKSPFFYKGTHRKWGFLDRKLPFPAFVRARGNGGFWAPKPSFPGNGDSGPCLGSGESQSTSTRTAPTVSYLWPTRTELSRKVSENRKFPGRNISVISPGSCRVTEIKITSCPSKTEFFTSHFCDLYWGCAASRTSFLRLLF